MLQNRLLGQINPLNLALPVTSGNKSWPLFHLWHHHLWLKLASSVLNFCRKRRSFQSWYPNQSDMLNGAWNVHESKCSAIWGKSLNKFTPGYSMVKIAHLDDAFSEFFELKASPVEGQSQQQKRFKKGQKGKAKKNLKYEKPKDLGHFLVQKLKKS